MELLSTIVKNPAKENKAELTSFLSTQDNTPKSILRRRSRNGRIDRKLGMTVSFIECPET